MKMKRSHTVKIVLLALMVSFGPRLMAQDYHHSIGIGVNVHMMSYKMPAIQMGPLTIPEQSIKGSSLIPQITYVPRLNFSLSKTSSWSLVSYTNLGASFSDTPEGSSTTFMLGIPVYAQMNWGLDSQAKKSKGKSGFFAGLGYDFNLFFADKMQAVHGPSLTTGVKFAIAKKTFGVGLNYTYIISGESEGLENYREMMVGGKITMRLSK